MHRRGHVGMVLLAYAPVGFVLLRERRLGLALLGLIGVLLVEPLPDSDFWVPGLRHRGTSHSILCVFVVGGVIGALGWVVGDRVTVVFADVLTGLDTATVGIFAGLFQWAAEQLRSLDGRMLAGFGFAIGVFGIVVHLLADIITVSGIRPFLPLSKRRIALSSVTADSPIANNGLFALGVLAIAIVFLLTAPGVSFTGSPAAASPVGVVAGQGQGGPTVELANQTTNGSTVTVEQATLPEGGFIVLHGGAYSEAGQLEPSAVAVSEPLDAGTHRDVTLQVSNNPPGGTLNNSTLSGTDDYTAILYRDSNDNGRYDFITSGSDDLPYTTGSGQSENLATSTARLTVTGTRGDPNETTPGGAASVTFENQQSNGSTVIVQSVTLPQGGWVVVHNSSLTPPQDNPTGSAVGISPYLEPGTYQNVPVTLLNGTVRSDQTLIARPSRDTNNNQQYDFIRTSGFQDVAYTGGGQVLTASAQVDVAGATSTEAGTPSQPTTESTPVQGTTSVANSDEPVATPTDASTVMTASSTDEGNGGLLDNTLILWAVVVAAILGGITYLYSRSQRR